MNDSELDSRLRTWKAPEVPADELRREVWQRIARGEPAVPRAFRWLDALLRPRAAFAALAGAIVIGAAGGFSQASLRRKAAPLPLADSTAAYVQSINPLDPAHLPHAAEMP